MLPRVGISRKIGRYIDIRKALARAQGLVQEDFSDVSGRTYLREVERGVKSPTLEKIDELARAMKVHPLTVITLAYTSNLQGRDVEAILSRVRSEAETLLSKVEELQQEKARRR